MTGANLPVSLSNREKRREGRTSEGGERVDAGEVEIDVEGEVKERNDFCVAGERQCKRGNKMR